MPLKPQRLSPGDTVGIVAPASPPPDPKAIDRSIAALERLGFRPKLGRCVRHRSGFLAGSDRDRAADLMAMFAAPRVKAVLCLRGGHGATRLLPRLDYDVLRANPKIFVGYSDITALHCAFLAKADLVSFHGPMLNSDLAPDGLPAFTLQAFLRTLTRDSAPGSICAGYPKRTVRVLRPGLASGRLLGGNLSLLCAILGTPFEPSYKRRILFFEDVGEPPYRIDRMLTHLLNAGRLQQVAGIAIGLNQNCADPKARDGKEDRQKLEDVFKDRLLPLKIPVVCGLPFGHVACNATLPVGLPATLDGQHGDLLITQPAVV